MASTLTLSYDRASDSLLIALCPPYADQETEELGDGLLARFNPDTNAIEAIEIFFFSQRIQGDLSLQLPILADLRPAIAPPTPLRHGQPRHGPPRSRPDRPHSP